MANSKFPFVAWKLHYSGTGKGTYKAVERTAEQKMNMTQIEMLIGSKIEPDKN